MTNGQLASLSWCRAPICSSWRDFYYCQTVVGFSYVRCPLIVAVRSPLTWGQMCCLQLLLVFTSAVFLRSKSHETRDHVLLFWIWDSPTLEGQIPIFVSPETGWPSYTPRHWVNCSCTLSFSLHQILSYSLTCLNYPCYIASACTANEIPILKILLLLCVYLLPWVFWLL
jgi:hypothetical protein